MLQLFGPYELAQLSFSPNGRYLTGSARMAYGPAVWDTTTTESVRLPLLRELLSRWSSVRFASDRNRLLYSAVHWRIHRQPYLMSWLDLDGDRTWHEFALGLVGDGLPWFEPLDDGLILAYLGDRLELRRIGEESQLLRVWSLSLDGHVRAVTSDGRWLAVAERNIVEFHDLHADQPAKQWRIPKLHSPIQAIAISPDQRILACGIAHHVHLYQIPEGKWLTKLHGPTRHQVAALAFSPDGHTLATAEGTGLVRLWDLRSWQERILYQWPIDMGRCITFAPDGLRLAVGGSNGRIIICDLE